MCNRGRNNASVQAAQVTRYSKVLISRLKKLESENESKTACISLLEEDLKEKDARLEKMQQDAKEVAAKHRQKYLQLEASLELKVPQATLVDCDRQLTAHR